MTRMIDPTGPVESMRGRERSRIDDLLCLLRWRGRQVANAVDQQLRDAPIRTFCVIGLLLLIWAALYLLLWQVLNQVHGWGLVGVVADQHLFVHFFLVLAVMLAFSNAILTFSSLYGKEEAGHLLSMPLHAREVVAIKWAEGVILSSWSFLLLGVPLMLAIAHNSVVEWYYYPLFLGHFFGFVVIPSCLGLLAAWGVALWVPRKPAAVAIGVGSLALLGVIYWLSSISQTALHSEQWLKVVFGQIGAAQQPFLPSTWTAKGIVAAIRQDIAGSLFYLSVVFANGAFLSWITVNVLGNTWPTAYSRANQGRGRALVRSGWLTASVCNLLFFYLRPIPRWVMLKDLRAFTRDAKQWSQMAIMFGLLVIYVLNLRRMPVDLDDPNFRALVSFLNLTTVSLILATFTSRFVYPLLSLESQQLWLVEMLPLRRSTLLFVKFLFALTVTGLSACAVMYLAAQTLRLTPDWALVNILICFGVCVGLSGLSIGLGARFPVLGNRNPARIASGFGGTVNLFASMGFVAVQMAGFGYVSYIELNRTFDPTAAISSAGMSLVALLLGISISVAALALLLGARHFERLEV